MPSFWTELKPFPDSTSAPIPAADRRILLSSNPYTHQPGDTLEFIYAIVWSRGADNIDSVRQLKEDVHRLRIAATPLLDLTEVVETSAERTPDSPLVRFDQYPNPFSNQTTLAYTLPESTPVQLTIYDILGRQTKMLLNGIQTSGTHTILFDGSHLPPGIYYATLKTPSYLVTRKLVLVR